MNAIAKFVARAACAAMVVVAAAAPALAQTQGQQDQGPRIRALMVAGGCCHDYPAQGAILMRAVQRELPVDWTYVYVGGTNGQHIPSFYENPDWYVGYDIVVHNECFTPPDAALPEGYLDNIARATKAGIPAIVIHCAMHSFRDAASDAWRDVQGLKSMRHGPQFNIPVKIQRPDHPVMQGIPADWVTPMDELYHIEWLRDGTVTLASAVERVDGTEHTLAWVHENQGARVFGTTLGHGMATWEDPVYQRLLVNGFRWAVGR